MNPTKLTEYQVRTSEKAIGNERIKVKISHDDNCGNGHNTFRITADIYENGRWAAGGCQHEEIVRFFPEFEPLIKWHLTSTDGPLHYIANTLYTASDKDCWGHKRSEPSQFETVIRWDGFPISSKGSQKFFKFLEGLNHNYDLEIYSFDHTDSKGHQCASTWTLRPFARTWSEAPFDTDVEAEEFLEALQTVPHKFVRVATAWSSGKKVDLEAARFCAIWPDGTLEELQNKEILEKRLPELLQDFQAMVESLGMVY